MDNEINEVETVIFLFIKFFQKFWIKNTNNWAIYKSINTKSKRYMKGIKYFMLSHQSLILYRDFMKTITKIPDQSLQQ